MPGWLLLERTMPVDMVKEEITAIAVVLFILISSREIYPGFSLVELQKYWALIGRELQSVEIFS